MAANSKMRRLSVYGKSFNCTDVKMCDLVVFFEAVNRKSAPRRRGPANILDAADVGAAAECQGRTVNVAKFRVRKKMEEEDVGEVEWNPESGTSDTRGGAPLEDLGHVRKNVKVPLVGNSDPDSPSAAPPRDSSDARGRILAPPSECGSDI